MVRGIALLVALIAASALFTYGLGLIYGPAAWLFAGVAVAGIAVLVLDDEA